MPTVDLVYDTDCPHAKLARENLLRAFAKSGVPPKWCEHRVGDPGNPARVRGFGSPTVLVDGADVGGDEPGAEGCCRLYRDLDAMSGAPPVEAIARALSSGANATRSADSAPSTPERARWLRSSLAAMPGLGVLLMPKIVCPLCWPVYAGVLSATGLSFLMEDRWLLPLTSVFLAAALAALAWRARMRRGFAPAIVGLGASAVVIVGKFALDANPVAYGGVAVLVAASVWNAWPRRTKSPRCSACVS